MHIIFNEEYNYYISNKFLLEECDEEEHFGVIGAATKFILKRSEHFLSNVTYSPIYRQVRAPRINTQSALGTAFYSQCYLVATIVHIAQSLSSQICVYVYKRSSQYREAGRAKEIKKNWDTSEYRVPF
jgi:hypothetical protein